MPFRCNSCNLISKNKTSCTEHPTECSFVRIETIHYVSVQGLGRAVGTVTVIAGKDDKKTLEAVKLHCASTNTESQFTPMKDAVTCLDCLATIPLPTTNED